MSEELLKEYEELIKESEIIRDNPNYQQQQRELYTAKLEKLLTEKYCSQVVENPRNDSLWTKEKQQKLELELKEFYKRKLEKKQDKPIIHPANNTCSICNRYSFERADDIYLSLYKCCKSCYILHYEGREYKLETLKEDK